MSWLDKETQIAMLSLTEMQTTAYSRFFEQYKNQALALKHTKIYMEALMLMIRPQDNGGKR